MAADGGDRQQRLGGHPQVAINDGAIVVAWKDRSIDHASVYAATMPAGGVWSAVEQVGIGSHVDVAVDAAGTAVVLSSSWDRVSLATRPAGASWAPLRTLLGAFDGALTSNAAGDMLAVWSLGGQLEAADRPSGGDWQPTVVAGGASGGAEPRRVVLAADGAATVLSSDGSAAYGDHRTAAGSWTASGWFGPPIFADLGALPQLAGNAAGDAVAHWQTHPHVAVVGGDFLGPRLNALAVPATATAGSGVTVSVAPLDVWSQVDETRWTFGDGAVATGTTASHAYARAGSYTVTVTSTDAAGNASSATRQVVVSAAAGRDRGGRRDSGRRAGRGRGGGHHGHGHGHRHHGHRHHGHRHHHRGHRHHHRGDGRRGHHRGDGHRDGGRAGR